MPQHDGGLVTRLLQTCLKTASVFFFVVVYVMVPSAVSAAAPIGNYDTLQSDMTWGWACDPDKYNTDLSFSIYIDSQFWGTFSANRPRTDADPSCGGMSANHGFNVAIPASYCNGIDHAFDVYALGVNTSGVADGNNTWLGTLHITCGTPTYACQGSLPTGGVSWGGPSPTNSTTPWSYSATNSGLACKYTCGTGYAYNSSTGACDWVGTSDNPVGYFDGLGCDMYWGWGCDRNGFSTPLNFQLYVDGSFYGTLSTNRTRNDVAGVCGGTTYHGFNYAVPAAYANNIAHTFSVNAVNVGAGSNTNIGTLGRGTTCPACGSAFGGSFTTAPTSNLCNAGTLVWDDQAAPDWTYDWRCTNGAASASCSASRVSATPSGTLTIANCTIPNGSATCATTVNWTAANVTNGSVYVGSSLFAGSIGGAGSSVTGQWIRSSGATFYLYDGPTNSTTPLATKTVYGVCNTGYAPDASGVCVSTTPTASITFNGSINVSDIDPLASRTWAWSSANADTATARVVITGCVDSTQNGPVDPWSPWGGGGTNTGNLLNGTNIAVPGAAKYGCTQNYSYTAINTTSGKSTTTSGVMSFGIGNALGANPSPCIIPEGAGICSTTVSWSTSPGLPGTQVYVKDNPSGSYVLWASSGASGSGVAPWIRPSPGQTFDLRNPSTGASLKTATVYGVCGTGLVLSGGVCVRPAPTASMTFNGSKNATNVNPNSMATWAWKATNAVNATSSITVTNCANPARNGVTSEWQPWTPTSGVTITGTLLDGTNTRIPVDAGSCRFNYRYTAIPSSGVPVTDTGSVQFMTPTGTLSGADCVIPNGSSTCATTIGWTTAGVTNGSIYVDGISGSWLLFSGGITGNASQATGGWVKASGKTFNLFAGPTTTSQLLASKVVRGVCNTGYTPDITGICVPYSLVVCSGSTLIQSGTGQSSQRPLATQASETLTAYYDDTPGCSGTIVPTSAFSESSPYISLSDSGNNKVVTGVSAGGPGNVTVNYMGQVITIPYLVSELVVCKSGSSVPIKRGPGTASPSRPLVAVSTSYEDLIAYYDSTSDCAGFSIGPSYITDTLTNPVTSATVGSYKRITGSVAGSENVTVNYLGQSITIPYTVTALPRLSLCYSDAVPASTITLNVGGVKALRAWFHADGTVGCSSGGVDYTQLATWSSSPSGRVTLGSGSQSGQVTGASVGVTTVTVNYNSTSYGTLTSNGVPFNVIPPVENGTCGSATTVTHTTQPTTNLCSSSVAADWSAGDQTGLDGTYNWTCPGEYGGTATLCSANRQGGTYQ